MTIAQMFLNSFKSKTRDMQEEIERRNDIADYFDNKDFEYEDIACAISWLDHTTKTADEIIEILEMGK